MYEEFASVYDALMDDFDYPAWAGYYLEILKRSGCVPKTILECGCGTGSLSIPLARRGIRMTCSDISESMLRAAQLKAGRSGVMIPFVHMDMRRAAVPRPVDAVIAACDAVNYLLSREDVMMFFRSARTCLKSGGVLAFDISSPFKLMNMKNAFYGEDRDHVTYLWQNSFDEQAGTITMNLTFFVETDNGLYRRFDEEHVQRIHRPEEITAWLKETGYRDVRIYGDGCFAPPADNTPRIHFSAVRE